MPNHESNEQTDNDEAQGNMPNELQIELLHYAAARSSLLNAIRNTKSEKWKQALLSFFNNPQTV